MEQPTGSKYEKDYVKAACCHPVYLTYMQCESEVTQLCLTLCDPVVVAYQGPLQAPPWQTLSSNFCLAPILRRLEALLNLRCFPPSPVCLVAPNSSFGLPPCPC